jgi:chemotaxis protein CheX
MLDMEAVRCDAQLSEPQPNHITGCVRISGAWQGTVVLQASVGLATEVARRMFRIEARDVVEEDLRDALAELTNMIGGNIKSLVPSPSFLSIPTVTTDNDFVLPLSGAELVNDISISCGGDPLRILTCKRA